MALEKRPRGKITINEAQFVFMPERGTTGAIFIVREMQEKFLAKKKDLYNAFVNLEKVFEYQERQ